MNCFESRNQKLIAPCSLSEEAEMHIRECSGCADFAARIDALEEDLHRELTVPIPDGLADRILLNIHLQEARRAGFRLVCVALLRFVANATRQAQNWSRGFALAGLGGPWRYALAALVVLGLGLGVALLQVSLTGPGTALAHALISHVVYEEEVEIAMQAGADPAVIPRLLAVSGVRLPDGVRPTQYLGRCAPPNRTGEHIVLQTPFGKATLVLMPDEPLKSRVVATEHGLAAVAVPAKVGSLAVVADSKQSAAKIVGLLK